MLIPPAIRKLVPAKARRKIKAGVRVASSAVRFGPGYTHVAATMRPYVHAGEYRRAMEAWNKLIAQDPVPPDAYAETVEVGEIEELIACPLCGTKESQPMYQPRGVSRDGRPWSYRVVRCPSCTHLYRNPNVKPERLGDLYASRYSEFLSASYARKRQVKYRLTLDAWKPVLDDGTGRRLLDFGCGNGLFLEVAKARGFETWGVDLSPDSIEQARTRPGGERAFHGAPRDIPEIAAGGFDVITMWSVLAHLASPVEDLAMLRSLLADDGLLMIWTVNANSLEMKRYGHRWNGFTKNHLHYYRRETLPLLLRQAGFAAVDFRLHYFDSVERGSTALTPAQQARLRKVIDETDQANMMRAMAFATPAAVERAYGANPPSSLQRLV